MTIISNHSSDDNSYSFTYLCEGYVDKNPYGLNHLESCHNSALSNSIDFFSLLRLYLNSYILLFQRCEKDA